MRIALAIFFLMHGVAHLAGIKISPRLQGLGWLLLGVAFAGSALGLLLQTSWWTHLALAALTVSTGFCIFRWPDTRFGVAANVLLLAAIVPAIAIARGDTRLHSDLARLWTATPPLDRVIEHRDFASLPEPVRRLLTHAIAPHTRAASAVHLRMHGDIKLNGWIPFTAEQVIHAQRGMIWAASTRLYGLPVDGSDRILDGPGEAHGEMRWLALGLIPVQKAAGPDIRRSGIGRLQGEFLWLPSALLHEHVTWTALDHTHVRASFSTFDQPGDIDFTIDPDGRILSVRFKRWGNPGGGAFTEAIFGGDFSAERTFDGYTIPTQLRMGWHYGSDRFEHEGEFFRATIDAADYR